MKRILAIAIAAAISTNSAPTHANIFGDIGNAVSSTVQQTAQSVGDVIRNPGDAIQGRIDDARSNPVGAIVNPMKFTNPTGMPQPGDFGEILITHPEDLADYVRDPRQLIGAPLASMIWSARERAVQDGVNGIPYEVRQQLAPYFPAWVLDRAKWTAQWGALNGLPQTVALGCAGANAVTLVDVVVFHNADLANNAVLWAHELHHIQQYADWGLPEFARSYTTDYNGVESAAYAKEHEVRNAMAANQWQQPQLGMACAVYAGGACQLPQAQPVGSECGCFDNWGRFFAGSTM